MALTASQILPMIAPQFAAQANLADWIALSRESVNACFFGNNAERAVALYAAHMMTLSTRAGGEAGSIASKREGDLAISFAATGSGLDPDLSQTSYGLQYLQLRKASGAFVGVTGGLDSGCGVATWPQL